MQLGLTGELQNQPEEAVELLTEAFNADPSWRSKVLGPTATGKIPEHWPDL